jgi:hypothetical protein
VLALAVYREGLCPLCGRPRDICAAPEGTHQIDVEWTVCQSTRRLVEVQAGTYSNDNHPYRASHLWGTTIR